MPLRYLRHDCVRRRRLTKLSLPKQTPSLSGARFRAVYAPPADRRPCGKRLEAVVFFHAGNSLSKPCAIRFGRFSPRENSPSPYERFPITSQDAGFPAAQPNRHLEHTIIPKLPRENSLEDFLGNFRPPLSFFADNISRGDRPSASAGRVGAWFLCP